jgi:glycosyltransferase involved in cell wall biosynthesis
METAGAAQAGGLRGACLSVVVPVYNEAATVGRVVRAALAQPMVQEVLVVDDGSRDGTHDVLAPLPAADARVRVFRHERNRGKGAALRTGIAQATAPLVLVQDADCEYDPNEYARLLEPLLGGRAEVVYGSRFSAPNAPGSWHAFGNALLTRFSNLCADQRLTDMETGFKAFRRSVLERISIEEDRFGFEPEITAKLAWLKDVRIEEVPVSYRRRGIAQGKKLRWHDGAAALWCIAKYNLRGRLGSVP